MRTDTGWISVPVAAVGTAGMSVAQEWLDSMAAENGYLECRLLPDQTRYVGVHRLLFTAAVIVGAVGNDVAYDDRWCYHDIITAVLAARAWDGQGDPAGWHRHPASGRRRAETGREIDEAGRVVPVGSIYVYR